MEALVFHLRKILILLKTKIRKLIAKLLNGAVYYIELVKLINHKITSKKKNLSEISAEIRVKLLGSKVEQRTENPCVGGSIPSLPT